ncbi:hypothetical protein Tco_0405012 [Tanacetum coccineum]
MKHQGHPRRTEELHIKGVLALGLALMMGRLVVLWPFCGLSSRLSAIAAEMGQLQNLIQESRRVLNLFLRSVRTLDPDLKKARIRAARERIKDLEGRQQALRAEQEDLIVVPSQICSFFSVAEKRSLPPAFKNDEYEVREAAGTMDPLTPNRVAFPGLVGVACRHLWKAGSVTTYTLPFTPYHRAFSSVVGFGGPKLTWLRQKASSLKARFARRPSRNRTLCPPATSGSKHLERNFHREGFNPATGSPTATLLRLHPSRRPHRGETYSQGVTGGVYRARHMCGPAYKGHANLTSSPPSSSISLAVLPHTRKERAQALKGAGYLLTDATAMYLHSISSAGMSLGSSADFGYKDFLLRHMSQQHKARVLLIIGLDQTSHDTR